MNDDDSIIAVNSQGLSSKGINKPSHSMYFISMRCVMYIHRFKPTGFKFLTAVINSNALLCVGLGVCSCHKSVCVCVCVLIINSVF